MRNFVVQWEHRGSGEIFYYVGCENSPSLFHLESTHSLGEAKVFNRSSKAQIACRHVTNYAGEYAGVIKVSDKELFEARLKGK